MPMVPEKTVDLKGVQKNFLQCRNYVFTHVMKIYVKIKRKFLERQCNFSIFYRDLNQFLSQY